MYKVTYMVDGIHKQALVAANAPLSAKAVLANIYTLRGLAVKIEILRCEWVEFYSIEQDKPEDRKGCKNCNLTVI